MRLTAVPMPYAFLLAQCAMVVFSGYVLVFESEMSGIAFIFAGLTDCTVGMVNTHYVYLPINILIQAPRKVNPKGRRWNRLITAINQPSMTVA